MYPRLIMFALLGAANGPVFAQEQTPLAPPPPTAVPQAQPAPKPATIKKTICRRVDNEETTGSRLGSAPKVCTTVEVPAPRDDKGERG